MDNDLQSAYDAVMSSRGDLCRIGKAFGWGKAYEAALSGMQTAQARFDKLYAAADPAMRAPFARACI